MAGVPRARRLKLGCEFSTAPANLTIRQPLGVQPLLSAASARARAVGRRLWSRAAPWKRAKLASRPLLSVATPLTVPVSS
ncbi:hypothetical protein BBO_01724 [Beauveria brongniartii RCEF 3172]|uniref:Uncharacterized protein n=1 Tax=Beauveria brongniartii RCEF 3172 TaxID=1081107 RepID=A0A167JCV3_9HYPO|nr:hypothetical protein BBO_01724 [Beauveria brongniartii RCEF 3172]